MAMPTSGQVGDFVTLVRGKTYKGALVGADGPALLVLGSIVPGGGFRNDYKTYGGDCPPELMLESGDLFVSLKGATKDGEMIGSVARLPESVPSGRLTQDTVKLVFRTGNADFKRYFYWVLRTPDYRAYCAGRATGSAVVALSRNDFLSYPVPLLTPIRTQIVEVLERIENKIESNRRLAQNLQSLFRLQFERVVASAEVEWARISDIATTTKGVSYKSIDLQPSRTALVTLKSFDRTGGYKSDGLKPYVGPYKPLQVVKPGEVAVAQTDLTQGAEVVGRAVRVPADGSADVLVASLDLVVVRPNDGISNEYLLGVLTEEAFRQHCRSRTSGTTVLHLASDAIPSYEAPIVPKLLRDEFTAVARPLLARIDSAEREVVQLTALRGALLPELLSGRMRVPVEEFAA